MSEVLLKPVSPANVLYDVAEKLYVNDPSVRILGSLGRNAVMGNHLPEYRGSGSRRNLNVLHVKDGGADEHKDYEYSDEGIELSTRFNNWIRTTDNGTWLVYPGDERLHVPLPEAETVLAPHAAPIGSHVIHTLRPEVLGKANYVMGRPRIKDKESFGQYESFLKEQNPTIHPDLLKPFDDFKSELDKKRAYQMKSWIRNNLYQQLIPETIREQLHISKRIPGIGMTRVDRK